MPATASTSKPKRKGLARKGCPRGRCLTRPKVLAALKASFGIRTNAAALLGVNRTSLLAFIARTAGMREAVAELDEELLDYIESKLYGLIEQGSERSIHFYLSTKAKHRGYSTRVEQVGPDGQPIQIQQIPDHSTSAVLAAIERITGQPVPPLDDPETTGVYPDGNGRLQ